LVALGLQLAGRECCCPAQARGVCRCSGLGLGGALASGARCGAHPHAQPVQLRTLSDWAMLSSVAGSL